MEGARGAPRAELRAHARAGHDDLDAGGAGAAPARCATEGRNATARLGRRAPVPRRARSSSGDDGALAVLDRPRRHVHRHRRAQARRRASPRTSCSRRIPAATATPRSPASASCSACAQATPIPVEKIERGEDGHDGRHQRAARAQGRAPRCSSSRAASATSCASPTRTARASSTATSVLPELLYRKVVEVDERIGAHGEIVTPLDEAQVRARPRRRARRGLSLDRHRVHARLPLLRARGARGAARARRGLRPGFRVARGVAAHEDRLARRHDGGRCVSLADPAPLRGPGRRRAAGRAPHVHAVQRRPHRRASLPGQGLDPLRPRGRHRRHGAHVGGGGLQAR